MDQNPNENWYLSHYERYSSNYDESKCHIDDLGNVDRPLQVAISKRKNLSVIKNYLDLQNVNAVDGAQYTCLHVAVCVNPYNLELIQELLNRKANIDAKDWNGDTALHLAARHPQCETDLIELLISNGADLNITNNFGETSLYSFLKKCDSQKTFDRYFSILKMLLTAGANPNVQNYANSYPIWVAMTFSKFCKLAVIKELVKHGASLYVYNDESDATLHKAIMHRTSKFDNIFSESDDDEEEADCIFELVKFLVRRSPYNVNYKNKKGYTPLHIAVMKNTRLDIVKELINNGANVNITDYKGNTPLHLVRSNPYSVLSILVKHKADINALNMKNRTPLIELIMSKSGPVNPTTVAAFLNFGARVNVVDATDCTALHHALSSSYVSADVVRLLLENGGDPLNVNFNYRPPKYFCSEAELTAKIYTLYVVFNTFLVDTMINKPYKKVMSFETSSRKLNKALSKYRDGCISEIIRMNKDKLSGELTVLKYLYRNCSWRSVYKRPYIFVEEILDRIKSDKYPCCKDLLRASLKKDQLCEYFLSSTAVHVNVSKLSGVQQSIKLNYEVKRNLAEYLDRDALFNFIQACHSQPKDVECYSYLRSGTKRKYME